MSTVKKIAWVLTNLLSNAIRYSKENGRVIIGAKQDENMIELYVQDFGKGIDPRYHKSIFDRYFRVPERKYKAVAWDYLFRRILWKLMVVR